MANLDLISVLMLLLFLSSTVDSNTSQGTSTTLPSTTTTTTATTTTTTAAPTEDSSSSSTSMLFCWCNLRPNQCDVDCCCDSDCTSSDRLAFSVCIDEYIPVNTQTCVQSFMVFQNNTPYTVETTASGLFCINTNNYESANYYQAPSLVTNQSQFEYYLGLYPSYAYAGQFQSGYTVSTNNLEYYVSGDPVLTVYNTTDGSTLVGMLAQPAASASSRTCLNTNPAAYLYSETTNCVQSIPRGSLDTECADNVMLQATTYYSGYKVITTPAVFNMSLTVPLYDSKYALTIVPTNPPASPPTWNGDTCEGVVKQLQYNIAYAGTDGIANVTVTFTFADITEADLPLTQTFMINYYQNGTSSSEIQYSGNPGYLVGQPVRAGDLTTNSAGVSAIELNSNRSRWLTMVSSDRSGFCVNSVQDRVPVLFGVNMRSGCFISYTYNNMSSLCNESQYYAVSALLGSSPPSYIASFGNTTVENVGNWIPIYENITSSACSLTSGPTSSAPGVCNNIITGMNIQIVYANVGAINNPQPQIIGAEYQFICQPELRFQCIGHYCQPSTLNTTSQRFEIVSSVSFVDGSTPPAPGYGQIPSSSSTLPSDFFYPLT